MPDWPLALIRAVDDNDDFTAIIQLIQEAAEWLRTMGTDQWAKPWPTEAGRDSRVRAALRQTTNACMPTTGSRASPPRATTPTTGIRPVPGSRNQPRVSPTPALRCSGW